MRTKTFATIVIILLAVLLTAAVYKLPRRQEQVEAKPVPPVVVAVQAVAALPELVDEFDLPAVVEPNRVVKVAAEVAASVEKTCCEEGTPCKAGDMLVELNTDLLRADYDRAAAETKFDSLKFGRISNLCKQGAATERERDQAEADLAVSTASTAAVEARLERARITAPIGGIVNKLPVEKGEYVQPGMPVAEIVDTAVVKVVLHVPERDIQYLRTGAAGRVLAMTEGEGKMVEGTVTYISETADGLTRATRVELTVDNRGRALRSGQIVRVKLARRTLNDAIMIPLASVIPLEEGKAVYVVENGKAQRRDITLGIIKGRDVQVLGGLKPGDSLIVAGHRFVGPGQDVVVKVEQQEAER